MKNLNNVLKKIEGSVLGIGLNEKFVDILNNNDNVVECYLLDSTGISGSGKGFYKVIRISKIKRVFKKKSLDYIVCNLEDIKPYLRAFVKNSIYLNRKKIYFYGDANIYDLDELKKRYKRYGVDVIIETDDKGFVMEILVNNIRTKFIKNIGFRIRDIFYDIFEYMSDLLVK